MHEDHAHNVVLDKNSNPITSGFYILGLDFKPHPKT